MKSNPTTSFPYTRVYIILLSSAIALLLVGFVHAFRLHTLLLCCTDIIGCCICASMIRYTDFKGDSFIQKLCGEKKNNGCAKVQKHGVVYHHITLTDIGLVYFSGQLLYLILISLVKMSDTSGMVLYASSVGVAVLVSIWSLGYQSIAVKTFCKACLLIIGITWIQLFICFEYLHIYPSISYSLFIVPMILFCWSFLMVSLWFIIKPVALDAKQKRELSSILTELKGNVGIFNALLQQQPPVTIKTMPADILLGNSKAPIQLLFILSPYCNYCKNAFKTIKELLQASPDQYQIICRLQLHGTDPASKGKAQTAAASLTALNIKSPEESRNILQTWYEQMTIRSFQHSFPNITSDEISQAITHLEKVQQWLKQNKISRSPVLFINGRQLTKPFSISDIITMLPQSEILQSLQ